jgi:hypothetical protein
MQMSQVSRCGEKIFFLKRDMSRRQLAIGRLGRSLAVSFKRRIETVNALKDDVPERSLQRLGQPSRYLTVVRNCVDEQAGPSAMSGRLYMTRPSEAKPRYECADVTVGRWLSSFS